MDHVQKVGMRPFATCSSTDPWVSSASPVLGTLHKTLTDLRQQKVELNAALREKLGMSLFKILYIIN